MKVPLTIALLPLALPSARAQFLDPIVLESPNAQVQGYFGASQISSVPDVNGDQVADLAIGALCDAPDGSPQCAGRVYLFDGATHALLRELKSPSEVNDSSFGSKLTGIGDLNGNGSGDVVIATGSAEKRVYTFDGATGELLHTIHARGRSVSAVPDCTGDGIPDIARGEFRTAIIYDGKTGAFWKSLSNPSSTGTNLYGWSLAGVPDVNGDGKGDVVVSDWMESGETGAVYLFDGATGSHLRTLSSGRDRPGNQLGRSVAGLHDINGDGSGDVVVGASGAGFVYVLSGATGALLRRFAPPASSPQPNFGWTVSAVPDTSGNGTPDVVVGGFPGFADDRVADAYVFDPVSGDTIGVLPGQSDFGGGGSVAGAPDLNGDGRGEVLLAHSHATSSRGLFEAGHVSVFLSLGETHPIVTRDQDTVTVTWRAGIYDKLQVSTDHETWEDIPGLDARTADSHSEPLGMRGQTSLYRLARD